MLQCLAIFAQYVMQAKEIHNYITISWKEKKDS